LCVIEIQIRGLALEHPAESAQALLLLHRINNTARFEHGWTACIDEEDMLLISSILPINSLNEDNLGEEIADGLQRAESLNELWLDARERDQADESGANDPIPATRMRLPIDRA